MLHKNKVVFCIVFTIIFCTSFINASEIHHSSTDVCEEHHEEKNNEENKDKKAFEIGGEVRLRGDFVKNQSLSDFSINPDAKDNQILNRTRMGLSLNFSDQIKGFVQGQFYSRESEKNEDYSKASLYQANIEISNIDNTHISLKIGRQDFCYGSAFFLGNNDFYDGLSWDGLKVNISPNDKFQIDLIGARFVDLTKNVSDDEPALYGAYSSYTLKNNTYLDLYFFSHEGGFRFFHTDLPDSPQWYTLGTRIAGELENHIDFEFEPIYQFGKIDNPDTSERDSISTFGGHFEAGYTMDTERKPRLFAGYAFGQGDNNTSDNKYQEFHSNIYNDNYIVGDVSLIPDVSGATSGDIRASGLHVFVSGISMDLQPKLNLNLDYHHFTADKTPTGISKAIGSEVNLILTYELLENINLIASANRFFAGQFFKDAADSKKDIDYFYIQTQVEF